MSARALLADLADAGVFLALAGDDLRFRTHSGVSIEPYRDAIAASKPALVRELLQQAIIAAATAEPERFDRAEYDRLWQAWRGARTALPPARPPPGHSP